MGKIGDFEYIVDKKGGSKKKETRRKKSGDSGLGSRANHG